MADTTGEQDLRAENFSRIVKGFALQNYVMKQLCMIESSKSWTETYYRETAADLEGGSTSPIKEVPRLANFPYGEVSWTKVSGLNVKHGFEGVLSWEDVKTNNIPMIARTLLRIARGVTKSVDATIIAAILADAGNTQAANATWDNAVIADRDPIQDILNGRSLIKIDNYDFKKLFLLLHPTGEAQLLGNANVRNAGQFYTDKVSRNGQIGFGLGANWLSSNSVTDGGAQLVLAKQACTWKSVVPLQVVTIVDPGKSYTVRAWEVGQIQVTDPDAICKITGI